MLPAPALARVAATLLAQSLLLGAAGDRDEPAKNGRESAEEREKPGGEKDGSAKKGTGTKGAEKDDAGRGNDVADYKLTVDLVWASDEPSDDPCPANLEKLLEQLRKTSRKKSFRLEARSRTEKLRAGGLPVEIALPGGYEVVWSLKTDRKTGKPALHQTLINPQKKKSALILRKSPVIVHIEKIKKGKETLLLVVQFEKAGA
ncbi:MAG TPA: hypothetical protein VMT52_06785 [Planctomycetota bacterium]|nr:hypothetical protein [Planctomycetota bacterium]